MDVELLNSKGSILSENDLTEIEWRKICGKRHLPINETEWRIATILLHQGAKKYKLSQSMRFNGYTISQKLEQFSSYYNREKKKKRYAEDATSRQRSRQLHRIAVEKRLVCAIARSLSPQERIEFAKDMGFTKQGGKMPSEEDE